MHSARAAREKMSEDIQQIMTPDEFKAAGSRTFERHFTLDRFAARFAELLTSLERRVDLRAAALTFKF